MDWDGTYIVDDGLEKIFSVLPAGVRLEVLLDACHFGTGTREAQAMAMLPDARRVASASSCHRWTFSAAGWMRTLRLLEAIRILGLEKKTRSIQKTMILRRKTAIYETYAVIINHE
ncbi:MAG: hypothetical protein V2B19_00090 [Pseudomonadota bacterium]